MPPKKAKKILEKRVGVDGKERFLVEWEGPRANTWHIRSALPNKALLKAFEQELFEVEGILDSKTEHGQTLFLVKWKGFSPTENSWEPRKSLVACRKILNAFERQNIAASSSAQRPTPQPAVLPVRQPLAGMAAWKVARRF